MKLNLDNWRLTMAHLEARFFGMSDREQELAVERIEDEGVVCHCDGRRDKAGVIRHCEFLLKLTAGVPKN